MPSLQFKGKALVQNHHLVVPFCELEPVKSKGLSKSPSLHDNLIIEGDNLRALKALLPTYHGKVKCIYIDPPYNTGNEGWVYNDKVNSPMIRDWLGKTVDRDDLTRHDKWCCMMLPRLRLLRELLSDDGAIFVSIDDNESHHLRALMDEVFGEKNFVATILWQKRTSPEARLQLGPAHDFIHVYSRQVGSTNFSKLNLREDQIAAFTNTDSDPRGAWVSTDLTAQGYRPNQMYKIVAPFGRVHEPPPGRCWAVTEPEFERLLDEKRIWFGPKGDARPRVKTYLSESTGISSWTWWPNSEVGDNQESKKEINQIFGEVKFDYPKPSRLIRRILQLSTESDSIILDSFAGSGTVAHAALQLNKEDGGKRRFVLCQMPHETKEQEANGENIADSITAERVRRVIQGIPDAKDEVLRDGLELVMN